MADRDTQGSSPPGSVLHDKDMFLVGFASALIGCVSVALLIVWT